MFGAQVLRPILGSAASESSVRPPLAQPAPRPGFISARSEPAASVTLSVQRAGNRHRQGAYAPPAPVGSEVMRKVGEGAGLVPGPEVSGQKKWSR